MSIRLAMLKMKNQALIVGILYPKNTAIAILWHLGLPLEEFDLLSTQLMHSCIILHMRHTVTHVVQAQNYSECCYYMYEDEQKTTRH